MTPDHGPDRPSGNRGPGGTTGGTIPRRAAAVVAALLVALLIGEILALPIAQRAAASSLRDCIEHETLTIERVARPALPRLALGRVRDVDVAVAGLALGDLRIHRVRATVPEVRLPWALGGAADPTPIALELEATDDDLEAWLRDRVPLNVPVTVDLAPDTLTLGVERLPVRVSLRVAVTDGVLTLRPAVGDEAWWRRLGLATELRLPGDLDVQEVALDDGRLLSTIRVEVVPGLTDAGACDAPLATGSGPAGVALD